MNWSRVVVCGVLMVGCSGDSDDSDDNGPAIGDPALRRIVLEVDYEPGAEPYTGSNPFGGDTWDLFEGNIAALFEGTGVTVTSPSTLEEMGQMADLPESDFSVERILELDDEYRNTTPSDDTRVFHAIWLDGYFSAEGERQSGVIGVSIGDTGAIAMFKPVIRSLGLTEAVRRFGEQTTLVHEFGHATGLVNNGLDMVNAHQDEENGAHCDDDTCVMYWANEGAGDLAEFVGQYVTSGETVIFDDDCLADVQGAFEQQ